MLFKNPISIILIEDDSNDAVLIRRALRGYSQEITYVRVDTEQTLLAALETRNWDIALCDHSLPALTLDTVLGVLQTCSPGLPIVMVTGTVGEEAVADLMRRGVADVVLKDRLVPRLAPIVAREISQGRQRRAAEARMQRIGAVLAIFSEAADWREAIELSLGMIGDALGASFAAMCELTGDGFLQPIAEWADGGASRLLSTMLNATPLRAEHSLMGLSLMREEPFVGRFADVPDLARYPMSHAAASFGLVGIISQPVSVEERIFGISLTFAEEQADLHAIQVELEAISHALRPVLFRKISDNERTLLLDALNATRSGVMITEVGGPGVTHGKTVYVNRATCEMTGYDRRTLLGSRPRMLQGPGTDGAQLAKLRHALEAREPVSVELQNYRQDGTAFWMALDVTPVYDRSQVTHFIAIQTDITAKRAAEQERIQREASFRMLFESNPMPMWVYDVDTLGFLEVNSAAMALYGWSRAEFLRRTLHDVHAVEDQGTTGADAMVATDGVHSTTGATHFTANAQRLAVRVATHGIDYQGRTAMLAAIWDVTEMERGRSELRRVNEDLAQMTATLTARTMDLLDAARLARMGTWSLTLRPRITLWSPETFAILGQDPAHFEVTPASILACVHPDDQAMFSASYKALGVTQDSHEIEYRIIRPAGDIRVLRELARPQFDAAGTMTGIAGVIQDITEQKNAEQALLRAEKLKTIGQITGGLAHDFNNLLTVVGLNLEAALDADELPQSLRETLEPALHAAHRGGELTAQLLSYARRQSLKPRVIGLSALIQSLQPLLLRAVGERHHLAIAAPRDDVRLEIDPGQFENALMNIVINARDAMIEDGTVAISFTAVQLTNPLAATPDEVPPGDYMRVRVTDTGEGIDPEILSKIFEPFFTTKPPGTGTGLGLSMVQRFVHESHGWVTIASTPRAGTTLDLYLPTVQAAPTTLQAPRIRDDFKAIKRAVLLVEDSDALRHALHHMFEELGCEPVSVATAGEALDVLGSSRKIDLLFSDITLPGGMNGAKLASKAESLRPGLPVLLTSGNAHEIDPESVAKWNVLSKPFLSSSVTALLANIWP
jgi:PAS domain S-box-containing protein